MAKLSPKQFTEKMFGTKLPEDINVDELRQMLLAQQEAGQAALNEAIDMPVPTAPGQNNGMEFLPPPPGRGIGGTRGKYESPAEFDYRMNQGIPRGARRGGAISSLDQFKLMNQGGMGAEEARLKSNILRSRGGMVGEDKDGNLVQESTTARKRPQSSTGRDYDPVEERRNLLANAKAAVDMKKREQAGTQFDDLAKMSRAMQPGSIRGMANQYGYGQAKTLTPEEFANRPPATVTLGRKNPFTLPMSEEIGFMNKDMQAESDFLAAQALKRNQSRK